MKTDEYEIKILKQLNNRSRSSYTGLDKLPQFRHTTVPKNYGGAHAGHCNEIR
jgi:hypothetical protein